MQGLDRSLRLLAGAAGVAGLLVIGGCAAGEGIELQGGVFDALGVSTATERKVSNVKIDPRPGLVLPPQEQQLPSPGSDPIITASVPGGEAWPVDHDERRAQSKAEREKQHRDFCEKAIRDARIRGETTGIIMGPMGNCQAGFLGSLNELVTGKKN